MPHRLHPHRRQNAGGLEEELEAVRLAAVSKARAMVVCTAAVTISLSWAISDICSTNRAYAATPVLPPPRRNGASYRYGSRDWRRRRRNLRVAHSRSSTRSRKPAILTLYGCQASHNEPAQAL